MGLGQRLGPLPGGAVAGVGGRLQEADGQRRIAPDQRQAGRAEQPLVGDVAARAEAPQRDLHRILASAGAVGLDDVGQLLLDATQAQRREPGPQDLAVERVGQAHGGAPARRDDRDEPGRFQPLQRRRAVASLQVVDTEALADGQQFEHLQPGRIDVGQGLGDELLERGRRRQRRGQAPAVVAGDEHAALAGAAHELGQHLQVAAGQAGQLVARRRRHRPVERPLEQRTELVVRQRRHVESDQVTVAVQAGQVGRRARATARADGPDQEHVAGDQERHEHGHRSLVDQVEVVDEQRQAVVAGQPAELGPGGVEECDALVVADAEPGRFGQQVGEGPERDRRRRRVTDGPLGRPAGGLGPPQRLLGEA